MGPNDTSWLFRQGELILGPVASPKIIEKIYAHDLDGKSEVQAMGSGRFQRLAEIDLFKVHLAKADAKKRVENVARTTEAASKKKRNVAIGIAAGVLLTIGAGVVVTGSYLAVHMSVSADDLISVDPPTISRAKKTTTDEELVDYPGLGTNPKKPPPAVAIRDKPETPNTPKLPRQPKLNEEKDDPDGMQMGKFDQGTINAVVNTHKRTLFPCLLAINKPGVMQKIPIEFAIGNNGRVTKVWVDHPDYKSGPVPECLLKELQKWPFKNYDGETATVSLSFNIGKNT